MDFFLLFICYVRLLECILGVWSQIKSELVFGTHNIPKKSEKQHRQVTSSDAHQEETHVSCCEERKRA